MTDRELTPESFVTELARALDAWRSEPQRPEAANWSGGPGHRTNILKGDAVKRGPPRNTTPVLGRVLDRFGYRREGKDTRKWPRIYFHERHKLDVVAVECEKDWADACWQGMYHTTLALEVENDIQEFELTMRGLLDVRARLHCGIFFADRVPAGDLGALEVGVSHRHYQGGRPIELKDWTPPWERSGLWRVPPVGGEQLLAVFVSSKEPAVVGARCYEPGKSSRDVPIRARGEVAGT